VAIEGRSFTFPRFDGFGSSPVGGHTKPGVLRESHREHGAR
jgi:hypothetical protein